MRAQQTHSNLAVYVLHAAAMNPMANGTHTKLREVNRKGNPTKSRESLKTWLRWTNALEHEVPSNKTTSHALTPVNSHKGLVRLIFHDTLPFAALGSLA
jgi:hypothetical protein